MFELISCFVTNCLSIFFFKLLQSLLYTFNQKSTFTGLFDFSVGIELLGKEIVKCIDLAKDGIHALVVVFSVRTRFTEEEESALRSVQKLFGSKIVDYMIIVFTGGDELEENKETLDQYLGRDCPEPLKVRITILLLFSVHWIFFIINLFFSNFWGKY